MLRARGAGRTAGVVLVTLLLVAGGATAAGARWENLRSVRVTVSRPSLPPPGNKPRTSNFTPGHGLVKAQNALNRNSIRRLAQAVFSNVACTGGYDASIRIVKHDYSVVKMSAYRCANTTYGRIGGNLPGFLKALGISPP
jgi:RNase P protein component